MLDLVFVYGPSGPARASLMDSLAHQVGDSADLRASDALEEIAEATRAVPRSVVFLMLDLENVRSPESVTRFRELCPRAPLVLVAERGDVELAAQAISLGATDLLVLGDRLEERVATQLGKLRGLLDVISRTLVLQEQNDHLRTRLQSKFKIVGDSPAMARVLDAVALVAPVPRPVLIVGERGTGKESVARAIHYSAGQTDRPLVTVNCAAFSETLLESELFGYVRGAFTGAETARPGKFATADGGTLFLDEIGNMPLGFQQKILRVVEYGTYLPVGGDAELKSNARILAATNVDLKERIAEGAFLSDLYDRLAFEVIEVPRLRERREDIPSLAATFLEAFAREVPASKGRRLEQAALERLASYAFPGNIRELKNIIERAAYRAEGPLIQAGDIGPLEREPILCAVGFKGQVDAFAQGLLEEAMREANGVQSRAARALGLSYHQFRYYWRKYQSEAEGGEEPAPI